MGPAGSIAEGDASGQVIGVSPIKGASNPSRGLEVAVKNLQEYCNGMLHNFCFADQVWFCLIFLLLSPQIWKSLLAFLLFPGIFIKRTGLSLYW